MKTILETERLLLRPTTLKDAQSAFEMNLDPEVTRYTHDGGVKTLEEIKELLTNNTLSDYQKHGFGRFAVEWKETGEYIGFAGLKYLDELDKVDLGYRLNSSFWGRGIATEASRAALDFGFNQLNLSEIIGLVLAGNEASINVLNKLGFILTKEYWEDDFQIYQYSLTFADFNRKKNELL